jgi:plasmid stabilization system protein ParE
MTRPIRFDPAAQRELNEAADFYDAEDPGLGGAFLDAIERAFRQIQAFQSRRRSPSPRFAPRFSPRFRHRSSIGRPTRSSSFSRWRITAVDLGTGATVSSLGCGC